jgi:hypothetical protein
MRINAETLDPNMTVAEALAETARVRKEQARARNIKGLAKFYEVHREEILMKQRAYREANREAIRARNRAAYLRKISQSDSKPQDDLNLKNNISVT